MENSSPATEVTKLVSDDFIEDSETCVEDRWKQFWEQYLVKEDGTVDLEEVKKELSDFYVLIHYIPEIYCEVTGGMVSKHLTHPSSVISMYNEHVENLCEYAVDDVKEEIYFEALDFIRWLATSGKRVI